MKPDFPFFHAYDPESGRLSLRGADSIPDAAIDFAREFGVRIFDASDGDLTDLPPAFATLESVSVVFLSGNPITRVPPVLADMARIRMLAFKGCAIRHIDPGALPAGLCWLVLTGNGLAALPGDIGRLGELEKLALAGNALNALPESLQDCRKLGLIRLSANAFETAPPAWIYDLPMLGWYGDAGNAFARFPAPDSTLPVYAWGDISLGEKLGESPSSEVFRAALPDGDVVALKLFRGFLTSDGRPEDDRAACLQAGNHPQLMCVRGALTGHPDGRAGLALGLVPADFRTIGLPPSLYSVSSSCDDESVQASRRLRAIGRGCGRNPHTDSYSMNENPYRSCTRDDFTPGTTFTLPFIANAALDVAQAAAHLHARGLMHGDIYAHNIMADSSGRALLGDFGAASPCGDHAAARQAIDVRGYGCFLDDLLARADEAAREAGEYATLRALADSCMGEIRARPDFAAISALLSSSTRRALPMPPSRR